MGGRTLLGLLVAAACWAAALPGAAKAAELPAGFRDDPVLSELTEPTALAFAPGGGKVFVAEKTGRIVVYNGVGDGTPTLFADLRTQVYDAADRGLLGLAVDPGFPARPYVYALYSYDHLLGEASPAPKWGKPADSGDECPKPAGEIDVDECPVSGRLVRLTATAGGDHAAVDGKGEADQLVLVEDWCQQYSSHSVGDLRFGADGALYASGGEGASFYDPDYGQFGWPQKNQCGDPPSPAGTALTPPGAEGGALRAQDVRTLADPTGLDGALIRIDPDSGEGLPGNPMFGSLDANARRIVGVGFRNPFRFAIDPERDELYVANVGWNAYEEIDRFATTPSPVYNSGWPCYEGPAPNPTYAGVGLGICAGLYADGGASGADPPFFLYPHGQPVVPGDDCSFAFGSAVSGLAFYSGGAFPAAYDGALFFADPVRGCVYAMLAGSDGRPDPATTATFIAEEAGFFPGVDLEVGPDGSLYYVRLYGGTGKGTVHRVSFDLDVPQARLGASPQWGPTPLDVELDASASSDPDGEALDFRWDLDGNGSFETVAGPEVAKAFAASQNVEVAVKVSDEAGNASVAKVKLYPGDTPPRPEIEAPEGTLRWEVGSEIEFSGLAEDDQEPGGALGEAGLYWSIRLLHCPDACHAHSLQVFPGVGGGSFVAPNHDYPTHIEVSLTATDSRGLSATDTVAIDPETVELTIASEPAGLGLGAGPLNGEAPFELTAIKGASMVLSAPATALFGGGEHAWRSWSDGGPRVHSIVAAEPAVYTASYLDPPLPSEEGAGPPQTRILKRPSRQTRRTGAWFAFSSSQPQSHFRCQLDRRPVQPCRSPRAYRHLLQGGHAFRVFAVNAEGEADATPSVFRWTVLARALLRRR